MVYAPLWLVMGAGGTLFVHPPTRVAYSLTPSQSYNHQSEIINCEKVKRYDHGVIDFQGQSAEENAELLANRALDDPSTVLTISVMSHSVIEIRFHNSIHGTFDDGTAITIERI